MVLQDWLLHILRSTVESQPPEMRVWAPPPPVTAPAASACVFRALLRAQAAIGWLVADGMPNMFVRSIQKAFASRAQIPVRDWPRPHGGCGRSEAECVPGCRFGGRGLK